MNGNSQHPAKCFDNVYASRFVNKERLWNRHMEMAAIGAIPGNGVNRQALSREDIAARKLLISWAAARHYEIAMDGIGNLFVRRTGNEPELAPVMTGSHMDSQPMGGRFDGIYGVLAGLEIMEALDEAGVQTRRHIDLVAWTNEEGGRFAPGAMGSMVFTGARLLDDFLGVKDQNGISLSDALADTITAIPNCAFHDFATPVAVYVEAHIEQGPLLEQSGSTIGVVSGIQGFRWFNVEVTGEAAHAGTTPISLRRDALQEAVACISALNTLIREETDTLRFTIGRLDVTPNTPNTVPCNVAFSIDLRHPDQAILERVGNLVKATCRTACIRCAVLVTEIATRSPCVFNPDVVDLVEETAAGLGLSSMRMPSGAFHDALFMHEICPTGMVFVPCEKGISHNPAENATPEDLAAGAQVLLATLVKLANA